MAKINRPNNIVTLGQTAPVGIGQGTVEQSLPVVIATDQPAIPVEEQNKVQSEVALSLLGIPRSEVALGIFADVNTYDVDPGEWTQLPVERKELTASDEPYEYEGLPTATKLGHGLSHIPEEAGALLEAPRNDTAVLTSKRFFRYQPGRVSAATFGVKSSVSSTELDENLRNPAIRKYGIYDNFDGYYWETRDAGIGDQFCVARRTQALIKYRSDFGSGSTEQSEDYGIVGSQDSRVATLTANAQSGGTSTTVTVTIDSGAQIPVVGMKLYDTAGGSFVSPDTRITTVTFVDATTYNIGLTKDLASTTGSNTQFKADFSGDLVIIRDKLLLTHAAMYDPTLLKDKQTFVIQACAEEADAATGVVYIDDTDADQLEEGQMVMFESTVEDAIVENSLFIIKEIDKTNDSSKAPDSPPNAKIVLFDISTGGLATITAANFTGTQALKTPVPFIFPKAPTLGSGFGSGADIMFPYARDFGFDGTSNTKRVNFAVGITAGAIKTDSDGGFNLALDIESQVNSVNNGSKCIQYSDFDSSSPFVTSPILQQAWSNWIRHNVKSDFYGVYEYRIPRSRFSFDFLDGSSGNTRVFSDATKISATGQATSQKLPGDSVTGDNSAHTSLFDIDFENVLMKKIEFSWYGAVGALFLVYVPVGNGEARWVRVHHLRASNQLKVASLGNATLPLTYTIYGGGTPKTLGRGLSNLIAYAGGKTGSEFVVKYGSSYYIDGGDRGTVKLFNHSNDTLADLTSHVYRVQNFAYDSPPGGGNNAIDILYTDISNKSEDSPPGQITLGKVDDILISSRVITGNANDNGLKVVFVERLNATTIRLHLNKQMAAPDSPHSATALQFVTETGQSIFGLTSKTSIISSQGFAVRNRVQVYPTKLATAMTSPNAQGDAVKLELNKNVIFQENAVYDVETAGESMTPTGTAAQRTLSVSGLATALSSTNMTGNFNSLATTEKLYGWFYVEDTEGGNEKALFGFIRKISDGNFEFVPIDTYSETLVFKTGIPYLYARQYASDGSQVTSSPGADTTASIDRLSSINIIEKQQRPIVGTGTKIATFFLEKGSEYFDLSPYFDYNKDYISFPLTDIPDNLFLNLKTDDTTWSGKVGASVTWEEQ